MPVDRHQDRKNIVMCLSPGRCGTNLLALLLGLAEDTNAVHEPVPGFGAMVAALARNPEAALPFVRDVRLPAIMSDPRANYVETSHLFGKGFFEAFVDLDVDFQLIVLNRDPRDVARSLRRVKAVPARSPKRAKYLLHPDQPGVMKLPGWRDMSAYQLCFWYALEMERRKDAYAQICARKKINMVEIAMTDLLDFAAFRDFAAMLGLSVPADAQSAHAKISARKINRKGRYMPKFSLVPHDRQEEAVWQALGDDGGALYKRVSARYNWRERDVPAANTSANMPEGAARGRSQTA